MGLAVAITMKDTVSTSYMFASFFKETRTMNLSRTNALFGNSDV